MLHRPTRWVGLFAMLAVLAQPARAQGRFLPDVPPFELPLAAPVGSGFAGRLVHVVRSDNRYGSGLGAEVMAGEDMNLFALRRGRAPITLGFAASVIARVDLSEVRAPMVANDWRVAGRVTGRFGRWDLTAKYGHDSAHLGDEYMESFPDVSRVEWSRETLETFVGYTTGRWRLVGNLGYVVQTTPALNRWLASGGADFTSAPFRFLGLPAQAVASGWVGTNGWTGWDLSASGRAGLSFPGTGGRRVVFAAMAYDGHSTLNQFAAERLRYIGGEFRFDL